MRARRWANDKPALQRLRDEAMVQQLKDAMLTAERALLYALGFKFRHARPSWKPTRPLCICHSQSRSSPAL